MLVIYYFGNGHFFFILIFKVSTIIYGGARKAAVHRVAEGRTRLSDFTFTFHFPALAGEFFTCPCKGSAAAAAAKLLQSCPTLCDLIDGSPPGSSVPGTLQARILEWVAISFSNACMWKVKGKLLSRVRLLATPWTIAYQVPPSMGFSRREYWSRVPLPSPTSTHNY